MPNRWIAWGLVAVLALQVYTLTKVNELQRVRQEISSLRSGLNQTENRITSLNHQLSNMARASEWFSTPNVRVVSEPGCKGAQVTMDWSFRELSTGSKVELLYRRAGAAEWSVAEASPSGAAGYRADFTVPGTVQGQPNISVSRRTGSGGSASSTSGTAVQDGQYEYRVVARSDAGTRSSEPRPLDVAKAFAVWFSLSVQDQGNNRYQVHLVHGTKPGYNPCATIAGGRVRAMAGQTVVAEEQLRPAEKPEAMWTDLAPEQTPDRLDVLVRYGSGHEETHTVQLHR